MQKGEKKDYTIEKFKKINKKVRKITNEKCHAFDEKKRKKIAGNTRQQNPQNKRKERRQLS